MPTVGAAGSSHRAPRNAGPIQGAPRPHRDRSNDLPVKIGPYTVIALLGDGGNAHVYRAVSKATGEVAVKVMRTAGGEAAAMIANEFDLGRRVDPAYVAAPIAFAADADRSYLVSRLHRRHASLTGAKRGAVTATDLWRVAAGVARALAATHKAGVIHCDVKPANILVYGDSIRLIDFGISRLVGDQPSWSEYVHFSRGWAAPEQLRPDPLTPAADVFGWGCVVAALAHGVNPFASATDDEWVEKVQAETPPLDGVPLGLREMVRASLARDPGNRPRASDLADACGMRRRVLSVGAPRSRFTPQMLAA
jgi:serine/threonine protein kinase